ncbi:DUF6502 family protein [Piscinibacter sp.]|nr:DUF6502 family protein [Piscinibacter sp.]
MAPVARWLLRSGVSYGALAHMLKPVFVEAAREELARTGTEPTYSALSVLSGVHRKDVRALSEAPAEAAATHPRGVPLASQVYTRWLSAKRYRGRDGQPRALPRSGPGITFETLAREVSVDVHPRTVMDELLRLGLIQAEGDVLMPAAPSFTPSRQRDELTGLFAANAADHMAAAVHNLTTDAPRYLEQSVFADGLGADSVELLHEMAREAWQRAFEDMVKAARKRVARDDALPEDEQQRMRFGIYFYSEPQAAAPADAQAGATKRAARKGKKT